MNIITIADQLPLLDKMGQPISVGDLGIWCSGHLACAMLVNSIASNYHSARHVQVIHVCDWDPAHPRVIFRKNRPLYIGPDGRCHMFYKTQIPQAMAELLHKRFTKDFRVI